MGFKKLKNSLAKGLIVAGMSIFPIASKAGPDLLNVHIIPNDPSGSTFQARHHSLAQESYDGGDGAWENFSPPGPTPSKWLRLQTNPYGTNLYRDARHTTSMTTFNVEGVGIDTTATQISSSSNYVSFEVVSGLATNRKDYLYDLKVFGTNDVANPYFTEGGSMRDTLSNNNSRIYGHFALNGITNNQEFLKMPFIPVSDSASFFLTAETNGSVSLEENINTNVVKGVAGKYWTEQGNNVSVKAEGDPGYKPSSYVWNNYTNSVNEVTNGTATLNLENIVGWSDGNSNNLEVIFTEIPSQYSVSLNSAYFPWFGSSTNVGTPEGAGTYTQGSDAEISVDRYVPHPTNPGRRLEFRGWEDKE